MRFFLAGRDRVTGSVRLVSEITFASRQDALDSLSSLLPVDGSFEGLDLFVADIEQATPVVVYKPVVLAPPVDLPVDEPMADAWESPGTAVEDAPLGAALSADEPVEEPYADAVIAQIEAAIAEPTTEPMGTSPEPLPLVEALRRAADRMEAEGVVAPEPAGESSVADDVIEAESVDEEPDPVEYVEAGPAPVAIADEELAPIEVSEDEPAAAAVVEAEVEPSQDSAEAASETLIEPPVATQWPWEAAGVESAPALAHADAHIAPADIEERIGDSVSMLTAPADDFVPKPVIMGDYGATLAADVAVSAVPAYEIESPEPIWPDMAVEPDASVEPVEPDAAVEPTPSVDDEFAAAMLPAESDQAESVLSDAPAEPAVLEVAEPMGLRADVELEQESETVGGPLPVYIAPEIDPEPEPEPYTEPYTEPHTEAEPEPDAAPYVEPDASPDVASVSEQPVSKASDTSTEPEPLDDLLETIPESVAPLAEPKAYSHSGMDMNAYTCDDCVYVGTCPKAHEDSPATCGSFQWKSV